MNEELQKAIVEIAKGLQRAGEGAGQFAMDQAPLLAQEFIRWQMISGVMKAAALGALAAWGIRLLNRCVLKNKNIDRLDKVTPIVLFAPCLIVLVMCACKGFSEATKAYIAPRVVLIETAAELGGFRK